ncbi:hypothetical protein CW304_19705 [Bacillus sp. UFRGS-B20]|nr:hypothetical protein CW304_19705 [Bacillus sp. UFRGS-B20]
MNLLGASLNKLSIKGNVKARSVWFTPICNWWTKQGLLVIGTDHACRSCNRVSLQNSECVQFIP